MNAETTVANTTQILTFSDLPLDGNIQSAVAKSGITEPTPIQKQSIPAMLDGKDVIGIAQTGTGKTLAFGLPLMQALLKGEGNGLVLAPTRELALQIEESLQKVGRILGLRTAVLIGGASMPRQIDMLRRGPHIVIATPGRLIDHMQEKTIRLSGVTMLVLDEADRMLDMGFMPQIKRILAEVPKDRQTCLFSATLAPEISALAREHMKLPMRIEVAPAGSTADKVSQEFFVIPKMDKLRLLERILADYAGSTIVFTRTKHGAKKITRIVNKQGHNAAEIHGNRSLNQRIEALTGFKNKKYRVLVATDIAARGIDVKGVDLIINFDMPTVSADYVHRIGRTARAGAEGHAISFVQPDEKGEIRAIERLTRKMIPHTDLPELPPHREAPAADHDDDRPRRFPSRSGGGGRSFGRSSFGNRGPSRSHSRSR